MNTVSLVGSVSRRAGGLFESVRRLHQELLRKPDKLESDNYEMKEPGNDAIQVNVLGLRDEFTELDLNAWHPVPVHTFEVRGPRTFGYAPGLFRKLMALNQELVHVHGLWQYTSLAAASWSRKSRRPYLVSPHGMLDPWALRHSALKKRLAWLAYESGHLKAAACIRALCQSEARSIQALGLKIPICIIGNGVDLPEEPQQTWNAGNSEIKTPSNQTIADAKALSFTSIEVYAGSAFAERKVLLYLGRLHPKKGLPNLLRAWTKVRRPREWLLAIAGWDQGGHEAELKKSASELEIWWAEARPEPRPQASVVFLGPQFGAAKRHWLQRCDAFILPSFSEGLPMAVLEAWAHAKPVLITPQCNLSESFAAGAAIPIEATDDGIIVGLEELFRAPGSALEGIGARGRRLVASRFSWPQVAAELKTVYHWMIGTGPKPGSVLIP